MPPLKKEKIKLGAASPLDLWLGGRTSKNNYQDLYQSLKEGTEETLIRFLDSSSKISHEILTDESGSLQKRELSASSLCLVPPLALTIPHETVLISSFTSLSKKGQASPLIEMPPSDFENPIKTLETLPAGKETGILLHALFEKIPFVVEEAFPLIEKMLKGSPFAPWMNPIKEMVQDVLEADLFGFKLKDVSRDGLFREQEFLYPSEAEKGYLKGVVDLVFKHQGKYYVLDWKSNWLGKSPLCYDEDRMRASMDENKYALQAKIYASALERYISLFEEKPFEELFGGAYYIYLRGVKKDSSKTGIFFLPPNALLELVEK